MGGKRVLAVHSYDNFKQAAPIPDLGDPHMDLTGGSGLALVCRQPPEQILHITPLKTAPAA